MHLPAVARPVVLLAIAMTVLSGCKQQAETKPEKKPRPVEVTPLTVTQPVNESMVTATVASWKTEEIGFEVSGRVESVVEPNTNIEGRVSDSNGNQLIKGTPIARLNSERFELQVQSQEAQVSRAEQAIEASKIQIEKTFPAQLRAAEAEKKRAETEYERSKRLVAQNAGAQSDVDRDEAAFNTAISQIEQIHASAKAQQAELQSLEAQLLQARDSLRDAQRNLEDCTLYSSFRGQIANVSVVPGSVVTAGAPVATIQMMDPIKVEVEVSAEDSRRMRNRQRIPVLVTRDDGPDEERSGYLYLVDPVADPQTRTFTLTLLVINERTTDEAKAMGIPSMDQTWRVNFEFLPGAGDGTYFVHEEAIGKDDQGSFLWKLTNMSIDGELPEDRVLTVKKSRVRLGQAKVPFLGNWIFQQIEILDEGFDPDSDLIAGELKFPGGDIDEWDGDKILFQNEGQWMLRPGDLVKLNLADKGTTSGYFVPMDAIGYEFEKTFLFLLNEENSTVQRVEVKVLESPSGTSSVVAIEPMDSSVDLKGRKYVNRGAHYLVDGEKVRAVESGAAQ
ncbi:efflux RND transporter periplasmic adaptor subunit [Mariniblastus fucicola]|uniref:Macrolide export protein MacA n=1 Tax=Mariniblastus fucicola TaxID=980251 RepID=A0A5B9PIU2_9BACT|nr:HlyD family efflux transporter periplasmic adaptor subunit [Mariniblastus fucicola]QEG22671.1 Macrolide export protein MacA [Mariniblastus fucicola]